MEQQEVDCKVLEITRGIGVKLKEEFQRLNLKVQQIDLSRPTVETINAGDKDYSLTALFKYMKAVGCKLEFVDMGSGKVVKVAEDDGDVRVFLYEKTGDVKRANVKKMYDFIKTTTMLSFSVNIRSSQQILSVVKNNYCGVGDLAEYDFQKIAYEIGAQVKNILLSHGKNPNLLHIEMNKQRARVYPIILGEQKYRMNKLFEVLHYTNGTITIQSSIKNIIIQDENDILQWLDNSLKETEWTYYKVSQLIYCNTATLSEIASKKISISADIFYKLLTVFGYTIQIIDRDKLDCQDLSNNPPTFAQANTNNNYEK